MFDQILNILIQKDFESSKSSFDSAVLLVKKELGKLSYSNPSLDLLADEIVLFYFASQLFNKLKDDLISRSAKQDSQFFLVDVLAEMESSKALLDQLLCTKESFHQDKFLSEIKIIQLSNRSFVENLKLISDRFFKVHEHALLWDFAFYCFSKNSNESNVLFE